MKKIMISISFLLVLTQCNGAQNLGEPEPRPGPNPINPGIGLPTTSQMNTFSGEEEFANFLQLAFNNQEKSDAENNSVNSIADGDVTMDAEPSSSSSNTNITNNQEAGADEGGLVKNYKNFLIALRQGRLVTVKIGDGNTLQKISQVSLPLNNLDSTVWYDELLVQDDHVIVVGYRYLNKGPYYGATELNFFRLSEDGKLDHQQTYLLESSDYYSWENYASRLVDGKLVLYMPYYFSNFLDDNNNLSIPKILKVEPNGNWVEYRSLFQATDVYKPITKVAFPTLHTILTCDVENIGDLNCQAKVVPANWQHAYYVSPKNAYLWVGEQNYEYCYDDVVDDYVSADIDTYSIGNCNTDEPTQNTIFAFNLNGQESGAIHVKGAPMDQFSFSENDNGLSVFLVSYGSENPCNADTESYSQSQFLASLPFDAFGSTPGSAEKERYTCLPGNNVWLNRFSPTHLAYGGDQNLNIVERKTGEITQLDLSFALERLELADKHFMAIGTRYNNSPRNYSYDLVINRINLDGKPTLDEPYQLRNTAQGEWRSHGYLYHQSKEGGLFGIATFSNDDSAYSDDSYYYSYVPQLHFFSVTDKGQIENIGVMKIQDFQTPTESCTTSCIDWYGNTRPIFLNGQILGLMGDQMGIGSLDSDQQLTVDQYLNLFSGEELML